MLSIYNNTVVLQSLVQLKNEHPDRLSKQSINIKPHVIQSKLASSANFFDSVLWCSDNHMDLENTE